MFIGDDKMPEEQVNKVTVRGFLVEESFGNIPLIDIATDYYCKELQYHGDECNSMMKN